VNEWIITAEELKKCINQVTLVDVRELEEYEISHIDGCKLIPLGELLNRAESELNREDDIVLYCAHGIRSLHGLLALRQLGYTKLRSLDDGIVAWDSISS
jgi:adenylyltransferase/sulfurtransferase